MSAPDPAPPRLHLRSLDVTDPGGQLGSSLLLERMISNKRLKQQFRHVEHDFFVDELPRAAGREKDRAADAARARAEAVKKQSAKACRSAHMEDESREFQWVFEGDAGRHTPFDLSSSPAAAGAATPGPAGAASSSSVKRHSHSNRTTATPVLNGHARRQLVKRHQHQQGASPATTATASSASKSATGPRRANAGVTSSIRFSVDPESEGDVLQQKSAAASQHLVRQLELLRMRAPTPTMSNDVADAFTTMHHQQPHGDDAQQQQSTMTTMTSNASFTSSSSTANANVALPLHGRSNTPSMSHSHSHSQLFCRHGASTPQPSGPTTGDAGFQSLEYAVGSQQPLVGSPHRMPRNTRRPSLSSASSSSRVVAEAAEAAPTTSYDGTAPTPMGETNDALCGQLRVDISNLPAARQPTRAESVRALLATQQQRGGRGLHAVPLRYVHM